MEDSIFIRLLRLIVNDGGCLFSVVFVVFIVFLFISSFIYEKTHKRRD